jgi:hypothetical protein
MLPRMSLPVRVYLWRFLSLLSLLILPAAASAQMPQGPPMPLVTDLAKVPVGSWAQYSVTAGTLPPSSMRVSLVAKGPTYNTIEMAVEGGAMAKVGKVVMQMTLRAGADRAGTVQKMIMQLGANDPMEMPNAGTDAQFSKPDPKTFIKEETVKATAGSFKAKHYHIKTPQEDSADYWVTEKVAPIGLVKMEIASKSNAIVKGPVKMELTGSGRDAKASITKPAKPFDATTLQNEAN